MATAVAITFIFCLLAVRLFVVQVVSGEELQKKAVDQWTRELPVTAVRGKITDVSGKVLADNKSTFAVFVRPRCVTDAATVAEVLSNLFGVDRETLEKRLKTTNASELTIKRDVDKSKIEELENYSLDGVYYSIDNTRVYPYGEALCKILGVTSGDGSGIYGLEKYYDKYLKGIDGEFLYEADLVGIDLPDATPEYVAAVNGLNVQLNIDIEIQQICEAAVYKAHSAYTPKSVSVVVLEPSSGRVLALASTPTFDLNAPPKDDIDLFNQLIRCPLIVDSYEPGSTFKTVTAAADIEEYYKGNQKAFSLEHVFNSSRIRVVGGRQIKCWSTHLNGKHANERLQEALNNSCNPCFVDIALSLGKTTMYDYIESLNYGKVTGIDFPGEAAGMVLPLSAVTEGDIARISFGQTIAVTPLQLAAATSALVNGGVYYSPQIAKSIVGEDGQTIEEFLPKKKGRAVSEQTSKTLRGYLEQVVAVGSGNKAYIEGYRVGGKTGTAQKYENGVIAQGKYVMSFVGFFPSNDPKYLALAVVDEPIGGQYGSTVAAPIVKEVFEKIIAAKRIKPVSA